MSVKYLNHLPFEQVVFWRAFLSCVGIFLYLKFKGVSLRGHNKKLLLLRGVAGTVALTLFFYTLQKMPLATAVTIQYLSPLFTVLFSSLFFKEKVGLWHWLCSLVGFAGVWVIQGFDARVSLLDASLGVLAAMASAVAYNSVRALKNSDHEWVVVFYFPLIASFVTFPWALSRWQWPGRADWLPLMVIGFFTVVAQLYLTKAYHAEAASRLAAFNYVGVLWAVLFGSLFFGEGLPGATLVGMALILISVAMSSWSRA